VFALARVALAAVISLAFTLGSLLLVTGLNSPIPPQPDPHARHQTRTVHVAPPPPPRPVTAAPTVDGPADAATPADAPPTGPPPPPAAAPAGLAPSASPGGIALGSRGGDLPSVAGLPGLDVPQVPRKEAYTPARPLQRPPPKYPPVAQRRGIEGSVTVRIRIDETGRVVDAVVVASEPRGMFDAAALQTARRYRFAPAREGGKAVASTLQQTIRFEVE
jgi:protein TonB